MTIKSNIKSVLRELSPILVGFKVAVILIGYFGLGSVAKWVITYWYPFTRWVWDEFSHLLSLPEFPLMVKDSLTALVFFLPLGIVAIWQKVAGNSKINESHRFLGGLFGFLFLCVICKDVISGIYDAVSGMTDRNLDPKINLVFACVTLIGMIVGMASKILDQLREKNDAGVGALDGHFAIFRFVTSKNFIRASVIFNILLAFGVTALSIYVSAGAPVDLPNEASYAMAILFIISLSLLFSTLYAPTKLYVSTGAAIAFIIAALLFELFVAAKVFMENAGTA